MTVIQTPRALVRSFLPVLLAATCAVSVVASASGQPAVGKWHRHVISLPNATYSQNPFELEVDATFTHPASGTSWTLPGYYAGADCWKIGFMPTETGAWTWSTASTDPELNGVAGTLDCVASGLPGMLRADPVNPSKWKLTDGDHEVPIALRMEFFFEPATGTEFAAAADFLRDEVGGRLYETRLTTEHGWYGGRHDWIFQGSWTAHQFDLAVWDRMEERMEILAERGLGAHVMFYDDDAGAPGWAGRSATEALVIRYAVARLAAYPIVWFSVGIDVSEFRNQTDVNWFGQQLALLDPYAHPMSSRHGGGSGGIVMSGQSFDSDGYRTAEVGVMTQAWNGSPVPVSFDDAWGENRGSHPEKDHTPEDIRRAFWKCLVSGGVGGLVRGGGDGLPDTGYFSILNVATDLESEQWLRLVHPFLRTRLGNTFGVMVPAPGLVSSNAHCLADPARTHLVYFATGVNDTYDPNDGGPITARLAGESGDWWAFWFDPRTGTESPLGQFTGGSDHVFVPPSPDDWVLLLGPDSIVAAPEDSLVTPSDPTESLGLLENRPNPFENSTQIRFDVPDTGDGAVAVTVSLFDVEGRRVRVLLDREMAPGGGSVDWNGRDADGNPVTPGIYFARLEAAGERRVRKVLRIR